MDIENCWEAKPILDDGHPRWMLRRIHKDGHQLFRDAHGHFGSIDELRAAIDHLESEPVRFEPKETP